MDQIEVEGLDIAYERAGAGPPLVLLHGFVGDGPATWRRQIDELSRDFTVVAWDAPGAGQSSDPPELWGMAGYADCLAAFMHAIGAERGHVAGLSSGGTLALALYGRHPAIPVTLTLVAAYAGWTGSLPAEAADERLRQALSLSELRPSDLVDALLPSMFSSRVAPEDASAFEASMRNFHPVGFRAMARAAHENLRHVLPNVAVPTLVIHGDEDQRAPNYVAEDLRASIPTARLVTLPGVGHVCNLDAPQQFNDEVRGFLSQHSDK